MIASFDGPINLGIFSLLTLGWMYYTFQILFNTKDFYDRFSMSHDSTFIGKLAGSFGAAAFTMHVTLHLVGPGGSWYLFTFLFVQSVVAALSGFFTVQQLAGTRAATRCSPECYIAPSMFALGYGILLVRMSGIVYP